MSLSWSFPSTRWWRGLALLALGALTLCGEVTKEYQLKAAFLYNFAKFVDWPADSFAGGDAPIVIAVLGPGPFGDELAKTVAGRQANGRALVVRSVATADEVRGAHLLFVSADQENRWADMAFALREVPLLVVGESDQPGPPGGVITFVREADRVRFAINLETAEARRLKLSAQLLKLAVAVHRKS